MKKIKGIMLIMLCMCMCIFAQGCSSNENGEKGSNSNNTKQESNETKGESNKTSEEPVLSGSVVGINQKTISIIKSDRKSDEVTTAPKKGTEKAKENTVTFEVTDKTTVIVSTVSSDKLSSSESKGSLSDIKEDLSVDVWGSKEKDKVVASKVVVYVSK